MAGLLADIFSAGDTAKRKLRGLLGDPVGTVTQFVNNENDRAGRLKELTYEAASETGMGPKSQKLAGLLADSYNPIGMTSVKGPQTQALETARKNAVKMLGLAEDNTPMDRAKALGFDMDVYHGSPNPNIRSFDKSLAGKNTGSAYDDYVFSTNEPANASGYSLSWDSFKKQVAETPEYIAEEKTRNANMKALADAFSKKDAAEVYRLREDLKKGYEVHQRMYDDFLNNKLPSEGSSVYPLMVRSDDFYPTSADGKLWREVNQNAIDSSKHWGYDGVRIQKVRDNAGSYGGLSDVYATDNPSRFRSRFAAFDPARVNENDLLGRADPALLGLLGLGVGGGAYLMNDK